MSNHDSEQIRVQMARIRSELSDDVGEVVEQARELTDWHLFVRRHPWWCVGAAAAAGFMVVPSQSKARPQSTARQEHVTADAQAHRVTAQAATATESKRQTMLNSIVSMMAGAVIRSAVTLATDQLHNFLTSSQQRGQTTERTKS